VLAGGRSSRFGAEKPLALLHTKTLLGWSASRLGELGVPLAVSARRDSATEKASQRAGWPVLHDAEALPRGPLDGICAGLAWAHVIARPWLLTAPCDVPLLPENYFPRLLQAAGEHGAYAESPRGIEGLCALWPTEALSVLQNAAKHPDQPSIQQCLKDIGARAALFDAPFLNVNTQDDLRALEAQTVLRDGKLVFRK
jgi:molybdopterin-guanine dinucleotide biosynthesis protein A